MVKALFLILISLIFSSGFAQQGFQFDQEINKIKIPFKLINNLIFVPIKVNGVELNFLLDTGVSETLLFSLEERREVLFLNTEKILLRGLGNQTAVEGLKSTNNTLEINHLKMTNHMLYILLDPEFDLSSHIGIPINGIIGYQFFRNNLVEINYDKKKIVVYKDNNKNRIRIEKKFSKIPITIEKSKPYLLSSVTLDNYEVPVKLLVDTGNSDAVWLFQNHSEFIKVPLKNFDDFLGKGFSGDVQGKRGRIGKFQIANFKFTNLVAAFPDSISIRNVSMVTDRMGSVGGEIMKRFDVVFDYKNQNLYLKKNSHYSSPFNYNRSGIEIRHNGLQWVQEKTPIQTIPLAIKYNESEETNVKSEFKYKFQLKPIYEIVNVRKNSPADKVGLRRGDVIIKINDNPAYKHSLQEINSLFRVEGNKWIILEVERETKILKFRFQLDDVL